MNLLASRTEDDGDIRRDRRVEAYIIALDFSPHSKTDWSLGAWFTKLYWVASSRFVQASHANDARQLSTTQARSHHQSYMLKHLPDGIMHCAHNLPSSVNKCCRFQELHRRLGQCSGHGSWPPSQAQIPESALRSGSLVCYTTLSKEKCNKN